MLEAQKSLKWIGIENPSLFLKLPDSFVNKHMEELKIALTTLFQQVNPDVVITFGPDGITGDRDHITTGFITDRVFDSIPSGKVLLHMAVSRKISYSMPVHLAGSYDTVDLQVDVSAYGKARTKSLNVHRTQFRKFYGFIWKQYVDRVPFEEYIIARNRDGEQILQECF